MRSKLPNVIKEINNMKRKLLLITIAFAGLFWPVHRAFMASGGFNKVVVVPVPPMKGRKTEKQFYSMLNNSGKSYQTWLKRGKGYIKRREYEQAILAFRKAIDLRPAEEEARFLLAWSYEKRGLEGLPGDSTNWEKLAENEYNKAINLADHLPARYNLAVLLRRNRRFSEARSHLEHILLVNPALALKKKAQAELADLFHQDMRPRHISIEGGERFAHD
jgi:tetratricopeptide (TPR) repeat protein